MSVGSSGPLLTIFLGLFFLVSISTFVSGCSLANKRVFYSSVLGLSFVEIASPLESGAKVYRRKGWLWLLEGKMTDRIH